MAFLLLFAISLRRKWSLGYKDDLESSCLCSRASLGIASPFIRSVLRPWERSPGYQSASKANGVCFLFWWWSKILGQCNVIESWKRCTLSGDRLEKTMTMRSLFLGDDLPSRASRVQIVRFRNGTATLRRSASRTSFEASSSSKNR